MTTIQQLDKRKKLHGDKVAVIAPARLHFGFFDMHGGSGRQFGSFGMGIEELFTWITASDSEDVIIRGDDRQRATHYVGKMLEYMNIQQGVNMTIHQVIPEHAGLGSGTQLSLAIGHTIAGIYGKRISNEEIASVLGRGHRSGIGIGTFDQGGFIVDGGKGIDTQLPPVISRQPFPSAWRLLLIIDKTVQGINGLPETEAFNNLSPMHPDESALICRLVLTQLLPALAEQDCKVFGAALTDIQTIIGDYFSPIQGGRFSSRLVEKILTPLMSEGATAIGQSSWGPTGFALFDNETHAFKIFKRLKETYNPAYAQLEFRICRGRNTGAEILYSGTVDQKNIKMI